MSNNCTVITAFFDFDVKKHSTSNYYYWIIDYLPNINAPMVIFTDDKSIDFISYLRSNFKDKTLIIPLKKEDFFVYKYLSYWEKDILRDHERNWHNIDLYMVWNEKLKFVDRAIDLNHFNTEYFMWTDIGMIREEYYKNIIKTFPNPEKIEKLKKDKLYLLNIMNFLKEEDYNIQLPTEKYRYTNCIGAGLMYGHKDIFKISINNYYNILEEMMQCNFFTGKEQSVLINLCLKYRDTIELVIPEPTSKNIWFYMLEYFA